LCAGSGNEQGERRGRRLEGGKDKCPFSCEETAFSVSEDAVVEIDINDGDFGSLKVVDGYILIEGDPSKGKSTVPTNMGVIITRLGSGGGGQAATFALILLWCSCHWANF